MLEVLMDPYLQKQNKTKQNLRFSLSAHQSSSNTRTIKTDKQGAWSSEHFCQELSFFFFLRMPGAELQQQAFLYTHTIMILFEIHRSNTIHNFLTAAGSMAFPCLRRRNCTLQYFRGHPNRAFSPNYVEIELVLFEFLVD
jgi:hypothetical protein